MLSEYLARSINFLVATTAALVVGKAVLVADKMPFLRRFDNAPLILPILFKTAVYWAFVFIARLLEAFIHHIVDSGQIGDFGAALAEQFSWHRFLFIQIWILVLFLIYDRRRAERPVRRRRAGPILFRHRSSDLKQTRRQRIRALVRLSHLTEDQPTSALRDPATPAHRELVGLIDQLAQDCRPAPRGGPAHSGGSATLHRGREGARARYPAANLFEADHMARRLSQALAFPVAILALLLSTAPGRAAGTDVEATLPVDGVSRSYILHLPPAVAGGNPLPLVVVLHGGGANADSAIPLTGFSAEADAEGFIVAYPNGTGRLKPTAETAGQFSLNAGDCCGAAMWQDADDVGFLRALVSTIEQEHAVDRHPPHSRRRLLRRGHDGLSPGLRRRRHLRRNRRGLLRHPGAVLHPEPPGLGDPHPRHRRRRRFCSRALPERESYARAKFLPVRDSVAFWAAFDGCRA